MTIRYRLIAPVFAVIACTAVMGTGAASAQTTKKPPNPDTAGWTPPPVTPPVVMPQLVPAPPVAPPAPKVDNLPFPKWSEFPVPPVNVPTLPEIAQRVKAENDKGKAFIAEVNALVWDKDVPEPFAEAVRSRMDPEFSKPVDVNQARKDMNDVLSHQVIPPPIVKD